jgi:DNA-binding transcriptional MerR regulator
VRRLSFIRRGRNLGFSVEEIRSLLALSDQPDRDRGDALVIARQHLHDVEQRILELQNLRDALHAIANSCQLGRAADCGVLEAVGSNAFQVKPEYRQI